MDWFCSCMTKVERTAIQAFKKIEGFKVVGGMKNVIQPGRSTATNSINTMVFTDTDRIKPVQLPSKSNGYLSVKDLKKDAGERTVFRKIVKSKYEEIKETCRITNTKYTDPDFIKRNRLPQMKWKRLSEILPDATFMKHPVNPNNITQGSINNCYWLSGIASLADREYRIKNIFAELQISPYGVYMCRLTYNGIYQEVVIDDYLPVLQRDNKYKLTNAQPYLGTDCWPIILEKCWAKLFNSFQMIQFGYNCESFYALSCAPVQTYYTVLFQQHSNKLFHILDDHVKRNDVMSASVTGKGAIKAEVALQDQHAYSILGVYKITVQGKTLRFVQIRNPYGIRSGVQGEVNPTLAYGPKDPFWNKVSNDDKLRMGYELMSNSDGIGVFHMQFMQFISLFSEVTICEIYDNSHYLYQRTSFANYQAKYVNLHIDKVTAPFSLILAQDCRRRFLSDNQIRFQKPYASISVLVAKIEKDSRNKDVFVYVSSKAYNSVVQTNYLSADLGIRAGGHYLIRIQVQSPQNDPMTNLTIGYYSPDDFQASFQDKIDDTQFLERVLLYRAKKMEDIQTRLQNASGWRCIENIPGSNLCYIAYRIDGISQYKRYKISADESKNQSGLYFLGSLRGLQAFNVEVRRGNDIIFVYMYAASYNWGLPDPKLNPLLFDDRALPNPSFLPIQQ